MSGVAGGAGNTAIDETHIATADIGHGRFEFGRVGAGDRRVVGHDRMGQRRINIINKPLLMALLANQVTSGGSPHQFCPLLTMGIVTDGASNPVGGNRITAGIKGSRRVSRTRSSLVGCVSTPKVGSFCAGTSSR